MKISVSVENSFREHNVIISTDGVSKNIIIPSKKTGFGSVISGGELLLLAVATCACNDLYREAFKRNIDLSSVEVIADGSFLNEGEPAENITYQVKLKCVNASAEYLEDLIKYVDKIAEIHNTIRIGTKVRLINDTL